MSAAAPSPSVPSLFRALGACLALLLAGLLGPGAAAQQWVAIDTQPPGTPAEISFDAANSDEQHTSVELRIHGFWVEDEVGDDGATYQRLSFPGLGQTARVGGPALPALRAALAVSSETAEAQFQGASVLGSLTLPGYVPAPLLIEGEDEEFDPTLDPGPGDTDGSEPQWAFDAGIYQGSQAWPGDVGQDAQVEPLFGPVSGALLQAHPVSWDPTTSELTIHHHVAFQWSHEGQSLDPQLITKAHDKALGKLFINWPFIKVVFPVDLFEYHARLLIVAQPLWFDTLEPFVLHKKILGFDTSMTSTLADVSSIRSAIGAWYAEGDPGMEHYVLLVGDANLVPLGLVTPQGYNVWSDDVYASVGLINTSKEVHVGRLSVDSEADLAGQLQKIMDYEINPAPGDYDRALLVAHKQGAPGKYQGSHQKVMNASYATPLSFTTVFGSALVSSNSSIASVIDGGVGVVAYRGHGSTRTWSGWNFFDDNWHTNNVGGLLNTLTPVVWNIACTNHNLAWEAGISSKDSLGEAFMEDPNGAVASYGATRTTSTTPNHFLNEALFALVYGAGFSNHAQATELAELLVWVLWPGHKNPWAYNLLGDPTMTIRRGEVEGFEFQLPAAIFLGGEESLSIEASGAFGSDLQDGIVSVYKASFLQGAEDELLGAWYLDEHGQAEVPLLALQTPGPLWVCVRDATGNTTQQQLEVKPGSHWQDLGDGLAGELDEPRLAGTGSLVGGTPWQLLLTSAQPLTTAWLCVGVAKLQLPFKGGVLVPDLAPPGFALPLPTDANGNIALASAWPSGVPSSTDFVFQYWVKDTSGPLGFTASNGLVGTTP